MNVLLISVFGLSQSGRLGKIARNTFASDNVFAVTTDFNHGKKQYCSESDIAFLTNRIRLHVPAYKKNLSFGRIYSHLKFALSLKKYLKNLENHPDLVYCAMPTSSAAYIAGKYCKKYKIPFVIDVIDLWPDSLIPIVPFKKMIDIMVSPWRFMTHKAYKMADYISGESKKYSEIAHVHNPLVPHSYTYLGVDNSTIIQLIAESNVMIKKPDNEIWIAYGGSLGQSYDFDVILKGLKMLQEKKFPYKMWFVGDGEKAGYINEYAQKYNLNAEITGRLAYKDLLKYLSYCDIAINSFKEGTLVVHSYKFNDYVATGCFVLNNLPGETAQMIDNYKIGYNFNSKTFNKMLYKAIVNWSTIKLDLSRNIIKLINSELDTASIYKRLKQDIDNRLLNK